MSYQMTRAELASLGRSASVRFEDWTHRERFAAYQCAGKSHRTAIPSALDVWADRLDIHRTHMETK